MMDLTEILRNGTLALLLIVLACLLRRLPGVNRADVGARAEDGASQKEKRNMQ